MEWDAAIEAHVTVFTNQGKLPLTKRLSLDADGALVKTPAAAMVAGVAQATAVPDGAAFVTLLDGMLSHQALALGTPVGFAHGKPQKVAVKTADALRKSNSKTAIARTLNHLEFAANQAGWLLVDMDLGVAPDALAKRLQKEGPIPLLTDLFPGLAEADRVLRPSTSAKLRNASTCDIIQGSRGLHLYIRVQNAGDIPRATRAMHDRLVAEGHGWVMVSKAGQQLLRSPVDATVGSPERLIFEGMPELVDPVSQDPADRAAQHRPGKSIDSRETFPDLSRVMRQQFDRAVADLKAATADEAAAVAAAYDTDRARHLGKKHGMSVDTARARIAAARGGFLMHPLELELDDGRTPSIADILTDPDSFHLTTLADPFEGPAYGRCKARIYHHPDINETRIHSLAHGTSSLFKMRHSFESLQAMCDVAGGDKKLNTVAFGQRIAKAIALSRLDPIEEETIRAAITQVTGIKPRALSAAIKRAKAAHQAKLLEYERRRRKSSLPRMMAPAEDAPLLDTVERVDLIVAEDTGTAPLCRNMSDAICTVRLREPAGVYLLGSDPADPDALQPPPPEPLMTELTLAETQMALEGHVELYKAKKVDGETVETDVRLSGAFAEAYRFFHASRMPKIKGVCTTPFIAPSGHFMMGDGLCRTTGLWYDVPQIVLDALPPNVNPTEADAVAALRFLLDEWLVDVLASPGDKVLLVALAATIIERVALGTGRPAWLVSANQRGSGKTTALRMISLATLGRMAAAMPWPDSENERRKAMLPRLRDGLAFGVFDNVGRGTAVDSDVLNQVLTSPEFSDRELQYSRTITASTTTIFSFTGNSIAPSGDFGRRCVCVALDADRPDPENRRVKHVDPEAWTSRNRKRILHALYTILLWNPRRHPLPDGSEHPDAKTGLKDWWHLVGAPLELLSGHVNAAVDFEQVFAANDATGTQTAGLAQTLRILHQTVGRQGGTFTARDVTIALNKARNTSGFTATSDAAPDPLDLTTHSQAFEDALGEATDKPLPPHGDLGGNVVGKRLKTIAERPADCGPDGVMRLRRVQSDASHGNVFKIEQRGTQA